MCTKFAQKSDSERISKVGRHLPKLWSKVKHTVFWNIVHISITVNNMAAILALVTSMTGCMPPGAVSLYNQVMLFVSTQ